MSILIATRGPKNGICNICGETGPLTEDHTPPKGCIKVSQVELHHILEHLNKSKPSIKGRYSQNGIKYRTLCRRCNSELLGGKYDQEFINFVNKIGMYLKTELYIPSPLSIKTKPQKIMRSLLGHIAAQGVDRYLKGKITEPLKDYMQDSSLALPESLNIYFWPYPYKHHVMARDCAYTDLTIREPVALWFLKFFPVAFMVTIDEPDEYNFKIGCLSTYRELEIEQEVEVNIDFSNIPHPFWPEAPTKTSIVIYGQEAIVSFDLKKIQQI